MVISYTLAIVFDDDSGAPDDEKSVKHSVDSNYRFILETPFRKIGEDVSVIGKISLGGILGSSVPSWRMHLLYTCILLCLSNAPFPKTYEEIESYFTEELQEQLSQKQKEPHDSEGLNLLAFIHPFLARVLKEIDQAVADVVTRAQSLIDEHQKSQRREKSLPALSV